MERKKINWLLILQGWTMLWVVIGHAFLDSIGQKAEWPVYARVLMDVAYSFHMPLFMLISGYLFYRTRLTVVNGGGKIWSYKSTLREKAERLLIPFVVFTFVAFALKLAVPGEMARQTGLSAKEILNAFLYPYDNPMREMWFIATLMWMFVLMPMWKFVLSNGIMKWAMLPLLLLLHFFHPGVEQFCIGRVFNHALWFYLGLLIAKEGFEEKWLNRPATLLAGIAIYALGLLTHPILMTLGGIVFSFGLAFLLDKYLPATFMSFRSYTYQIFLMGIFAQMFVKIAYRHITMPYMVAYVICILMGLYVPVIISMMIQKTNLQPLLSCIGLKK